MHITLIIAAIVAMAAVAVLMWRKDQQRQATVREWAFGRGWRLWPGGQWGPHVEYPGLKIFQRGHSQRSDNIIRGQVDGRKLALLDYRYTTGHGKNRRTHRRGVLVLETGFPVIPLQIRPETPLDRVGEFMGMDDIDFESAEFSKRFYVKSSDRKWAYDILHGRVMELLLREAAGLSIEYGQFEIAVHRGGYCDPGQYEAALSLGRRLLDLTPDYLIREMKGETT